MLVLTGPAQNKTITLMFNRHIQTKVLFQWPFENLPSLFICPLLFDLKFNQLGKSWQWTEGQVSLGWHQALFDLFTVSSDINVLFDTMITGPKVADVTRMEPAGISSASVSHVIRLKNYFCSYTDWNKGHQESKM